MTTDNRPQVGVSHYEMIDPSNFAEFERDVAASGLDLKIESRPDPGPFMGVEWLIPTVVFVYIGKAYFDGFLMEAGKDHYSLLRAAITRLTAKFTGKGAPRGRLIFSPGKVESAEPRYSLVYSIVADLGEGFSAKLLLRNDFDAETCNVAQEAFFKFLGISTREPWIQRRSRGSQRQGCQQPASAHL